MAGLFLRADWKNTMLDKIRLGTFKEFTTPSTIAIQWLILELNARKISFKVLNLGAGVKTITTIVNTCPVCKGKGVI